MERAIDVSELGGLDASETASRIREGELKPSEAIGAAIERAVRLDPALNAIPVETYADARRRSEQPAAEPFCGVPTFVKNLDDQRGFPNDFGSRAFRGRVARRTEPFVRETLSSGLISLGRSAAPEIGLSATTEGLAYGPTRNPWNLEHSPGGSSGGAAALVASRVVPIALGSDAGGSIRIPASACGLVGLKPSRGRGYAPIANRVLAAPVVTYGVVTRSVRDSAVFVDALDRRLPSRKLPPIGLVSAPASRRLRIGVYTDSPLGGEVDTEVCAATLDAARTCEALGHSVEEIRCPYGRQLLLDSWTHIEFLAWLIKIQMRFHGRLGFDPETIEPWTRGLVAASKPLGIVPVARRLRASQQVSARVFETHDLLLCPTLALRPPRLGWLDPALPVQETLPRQQQLIPFTPIQNATGDPAISLPTAVSQAGLPIGVQFAAPLGGEATLLSLALEFELAEKLRQLT